MKKKLKLMNQPNEQLITKNLIKEEEMMNTVIIVPLTIANQVIK
jgi:hypothetical protein